MNAKEKTLRAGLGRGLVYECTTSINNKKFDRLLSNDNYLEFSRCLNEPKPYKPYLRDLSDLDKEIEQDGQAATPMDILFNDCWLPEDVPAYIERIKSKDISVKEWELLSDWHFNVFNLTETDYIKVTEQNNPY